MALSACNKTDGNQINNAFDVAQKSGREVLDLQAYCPKLILQADTETYRTYTKGTDKQAADANTNVIYQATITDTSRECKRANGMMTIRVGAAGRIIAGPKGGPGSFTMPIRVAVTRGPDVLYSVQHKVQGTIPPGRSNNSFTFVDNNVVIPIPEKKSILVLIGFDEHEKDPPEKKSGS